MRAVARLRAHGRLRTLHPGAWWLWGLGLAAAASRTTNPLILLGLIGAAALVVQSRKPDAPWSRSFAMFIRLGIAVVIARVVVQVLFGAQLGTTVLIPLPGLTLPAWLAGVRLGGDLTLESLLVALFDGIRLATILICVGAANSLASPTRLLKSVPAVLYEFGVSIVVALTFTPQLVADVDRLRTTRRLRGRSSSGLRAVASSAVPVLEGALDRSITLAAAMDSRGYGRRGTSSPARRRWGIVMLLGGLVAGIVGVYGLLAADAPPALGLPMLIVGSAAAVAGVVVASRSSARTVYRPDPWRGPEWLVALAGIATAALMFAGSSLGLPELAASADPPQWPQLSWLPVLAVLIAATPAWTAPRPPAASAPPAARRRVPEPAA
jgi:energy-coupling factor transport system permease protein